MKEEQVNDSKTINIKSTQSPISKNKSIEKENILNNKSIRSNNTDINILNELNKCLQQEANFSSYFDNKDTKKQLEVYKEFPDIIKSQKDNFIHNIVFPEKDSSQNSELNDKISRMKDIHDSKSNISNASQNKKNKSINSAPIGVKIQEIKCKITKLNNNYSRTTNNTSKSNNNKSNVGCFSWCSSN